MLLCPHSCDALGRAKVVLHLLVDQKDLKILITKDGLKAAGFLIPRVGHIYPTIVVEENKEPRTQSPNSKIPPHEKVKLDDNGSFY